MYMYRFRSHYSNQIKRFIDHFILFQHVHKNSQDTPAKTFEMNLSNPKDLLVMDINYQLNVWLISMLLQGRLIYNKLVFFIRFWTVV